MIERRLAGPRRIDASRWHLNRGEAVPQVQESEPTDNTGLRLGGAVYGFYTAACDISSPFLRILRQTPVILLTLELLMDLVFVAAMAGLWGLMVLLVWGLKKLEKPQGGRP